MAQCAAQELWLFGRTVDNKFVNYMGRLQFPYWVEFWRERGGGFFALSLSEGNFIMLQTKWTESTGYLDLVVYILDGVHLQKNKHVDFVFSRNNPGSTTKRIRE